MIDYDDLRRKAETAESWMKLSNVSWVEMWPVVTPIYNLEKSLPPSDILRLLRIIETATDALRYYQKRPFEAAEIETATAVLNEIAKIENE